MTSKVVHLNIPSLTQAPKTIAEALILGLVNSATLQDLSHGQKVDLAYELTTYVREVMSRQSGVLDAFARPQTPEDIF